MFERSAEVRFRANWEGMHRLEELGWEGWRVVVVPGEREWRESQYQKHVNSLTFAGLSNKESGGPQAAKNFVGWKL